ncbi:MAG: hypothetical protein PHX76_02635, partial [Patescibacteria group bacterium]|nr:hypothetical protein [Patescibacteria group bacterium]
MAPIQGKKINYFLTVLLLAGSFLFFSPNSASALLNDYNKPWNGTLSATEWNNLDNDFLNRTGAASMEGPLTITVGGISSNGIISASSFAGQVPARNVSSGIFGEDHGGGNYMFPGYLAVNKLTAPGYALDVVGDINFTGTIRQNGNPFTGSKWTNNGLNIFYNSGNVGIGLTSPTQQLDVNLGIRAQSLILKGFANSAGIVMTDNNGLLYSATNPEGNITLPSGDNGATLRYDSTSSNWVANTLLFNSGVGLGIGTTNPGSILTVANNQWISSRNSTDTGTVNMFKVNANNQIEVGAPLLIGPLEF